MRRQKLEKAAELVLPVTAWVLHSPGRLQRGAVHASVNCPRPNNLVQVAE